MGASYISLRGSGVNHQKEFEDIKEHSESSGIPLDSAYRRWSTARQAGMILAFIFAILGLAGTVILPTDNLRLAALFIGLTPLVLGHMYALFTP